MKRTRAKPRTKGTACAGGRRCIAVYSYITPNDVPLRFCPKHMADRLMGDHVKADEGMCRRCSSRIDLQWAHVHSRRYGATRWDRQNSMALCRADHMYFTNRPLEWEDWCRSVGVPWDELRMRALYGTPMDPEIVIRELGVTT